MILMKPIMLQPARKSRSFQNKSGWRHVDDRRIYFRSDWEFRYAKYLQWLKEQKIIGEWEHEPKTFWFEKIKRGTRSYLPDFKITRPEGGHYWVEVKGYFDSKSLTKIKRFRKYYPEEELIIVDKQWFLKNKIIDGKKSQKIEEMVEGAATI